MLRQYAEPSSSFSVIKSKHIRVSWTMLNDAGETAEVRTTLPSSPRDENWMHSHRRQLRKAFKDLKITICDK